MKLIALALAALLAINPAQSQTIPCDYYAGEACTPGVPGNCCYVTTPQNVNRPGFWYCDPSVKECYPVDCGSGTCYIDDIGFPSCRL